ncbi:MAG: JAB domain-containing protein [Oscillospiraceae bacterium]
MDNPHEGHRQRLKERFLKTGFESFQPHEVLELLLFFARPRIDTNEMAHNLINTFGDLPAVFDADYEDIAKVKGVGESGALLIKMMPQIANKYSVQKTASDIMDTSAKVKKHFFGSFIGIKIEQLRIICLDDSLKIISSGVITDGGVSSVPMNVRKIIEFTYRSNCEMIILAHNHPNGFCQPSDEDIAATNSLYAILKSVGIKLLDHIIVNKTTAVSMYDSGYFSTIDNGR